MDNVGAAQEAFGIRNMIALLLSFFNPSKLVAFGAVACVLLVTLAGGALYFEAKGVAKCQAASQAASLELLRKRAKDEQNIKSLSCAELRRELGSVSDGSDKCL